MADAFDPVTMYSFNWTEETPLRQAIGEAVGAASTCWERLENTGVYNSEMASAIVDELMEYLSKKGYNG